MNSNKIMEVFENYVQNDSVTNKETLLAYAVGATSAKLEYYILEDHENLHQVFKVNSKKDVIQHLASRYKRLATNSLVSKFEPMGDDLGICKWFSDASGSSKYDLDYAIAFKAATDVYDRCLTFINSKTPVTE